MPFRYERFAAIWPPDLTGDPSCRHRRVLAEYRGDSPPTIDPAQLDLPTRYEAEEQDDGGVFAGQRALCLHAPAEFLVEPLDDVRALQCFPLRFGEGEEREKLVTGFPQAGHDARAALGPRTFEGCVRGAGHVSIGRVDDAVEVVTDLGQHMLRALRSRLRSLWTQQRCRAARGQVSPTARRSPA